MRIRSVRDTLMMRGFGSSIANSCSTSAILSRKLGLLYGVIAKYFAWLIPHYPNPKTQQLMIGSRKASPFCSQIAAQFQAIAILLVYYRIPNTNREY